MSQYESLLVLLKPSIQKTSRLYLLFSFPFLLFGNRPLLSITVTPHHALSRATLVATFSYSEDDVDAFFWHRAGHRN